MQIFDIQLIYFIFALILGFIIGILLKKSSAEINMKKSLENLEKEFYTSRDRLDTKCDQFFDIKNKFQVNKDLVYVQNNLKEKTKKNINDYKKKISSLQEANENLEDELGYLKKKIGELENKITSFKGDYNKINSVLKEHEKLKLEEKNLLLKIEENEENIKKFTTNKVALTTKLLTSKKQLSSLDHEIETLNNKAMQIKKEKELLKNKDYSELDDEYEKAKTKLLNYKYKVKELEDKKAKGLKIDKEEISHFISKNESERFIDKVFLKFFNDKDKRGIL